MTKTLCVTRGGHKKLAVASILEVPSSQAMKVEPGYSRTADSSQLHPFRFNDAVKTMGALELRAKV